MDRRTFLSIAGWSAAFGAIVIGKDVGGSRTALFGHIEDAKGRAFGTDELINGEVYKTGKMDENAVGRDAGHWANGTATLEVKDGKRYVQLGSDFDSGPLPDGHVYVSDGFDINDEADFTRSQQTDLGPLKLGKGASFYELPSDISFNDINSVTIWCKRFKKYIGSADMRYT